ncbi:GTP-binding protein [Veillonella sp.]|uniref:CobW family GTP-binding protein n=2 Tax=Veillonella sp. TaxID=1926307 RepID=UPI001B668B82|nr:GTP-binding protein [Veillonella sp.]MBP9551289.1 hypothetical protein [Veillonella sp.]
MSIPITIISGFLGAGKTTFLQQILKYHSDLSRILIIENDFGQVNFDTQLLGTTGVNIRELTSGCICCSLQGDFKTALLQTLDQLDVDAIYIEPSGVGKLSDILAACESPEITTIAHVQAAITIIDATNAPLFIRNFGEFFKDQVAHGDALFLTHQELPEQVELTINLLRELNPSAPIHTEDWADINVLEYITESLQPTVYSEETCHCDHWIDRHRYEYTPSGASKRIMSSVSTIPIYVVTGFLSSGKTTFINQQIKLRKMPAATLVISGEDDISHHNLDTLSIQLDNTMTPEQVKTVAHTIQDVIQKKPVREIWLEWNGMTSFQQLETLIYQTQLSRIVHIQHVYFMTTCDFVDTMLGPTGLAPISQLMNADSILLRHENRSREQASMALLKAWNPPGKIIITNYLLWDLHS